ncbi:putative Transcription factor domain-containing protein [Seiridium cardinale]
MDHLNITIQDGAMVSTRRGFQVSKHKHNGTAFINSSANNVAPKSSHAQNKSPLPASGEITFVNNGGDGRKSKRKAQPANGKTGGSRSRTSRVEKATRVNHGRPSPSSTLSCRSPSTSSSDNFVLEDPHTANSLEEQRQAPFKALPPWASYKLAHNDADSDERLNFMALAFDVGDKSQIEDPAPPMIKKERMLERSAWRVQDPTSLHCALTLGALFDAIKSGEHDTPRLDSLASQLYSIVNRRVSENDMNERVRDVTMRAIASLAIVSGYQGKSDHWYVHMRGLLNLMDLAGGPETLHPGTITIILKADIIGAISAATRPSIPFAKFGINERHLSIEEENCSKGSRTIRGQLETFNIDPDVIDMISAVAVIGGSIGSDPGNAMIPSHISEESFKNCYNLVYRLLSIPDQLRDFDEVISPGTSFKLSLHTQDFPTPDSTHTTVPNSFTKAVETALRILALLYLENIKLKIPCREEILLDLLQQQASIILSDRRLDLIEDLFIDPSLHQESRILQRPVLLWLCVAGEFFTKSRTGTPGSNSATQHTIYQELVQDLLTTAELSNPDVLQEDDLEFCRCLDLCHLMDKQWDDRKAIKDMLGMVESK